MAELSDLPLKWRLFLKTYPWRRIDPVPWTPMRVPLAKARVALVSSAGLVLPDQPRFDETIKGGDPSFHEIPCDADSSTLIDTHRSETFDHTGIHSDPNLGFPIDRIRELAEEGAIGSVNRRHLMFMGSITAPGRLTNATAPAAAKLLIDDRVDAVLLVPV